MDRLIMLSLMVFSLLGALDRALGNKYGYGKEFELGFKTMGTIALTVGAVYASTSILSFCLLPLSLFFSPLPDRPKIDFLF